LRWLERYLAEGRRGCGTSLSSRRVSRSDSQISDDALASYLRIEVRELEAGGLN
jgi:hypothetical protein